MKKLKFLKNISHIHFIGICGYIMSATAVMLKRLGYEVTGSDQGAYPPATGVIDQAGIKWFKNHSPANLKKPDLVVVGNHIGEGNSEAQAAIEKNLKVISLPELIGKIFADKTRIIVAGTHGKTTTTSLIAWILETSGLDPSYLAGGIMLNTNRGFKLGEGSLVVIEGDEYRTAFFDLRPKFFHYQPDIAVLTTCELDHPDYFGSFSEVQENFLKFLNLVPKDGLVVGGIDDSQVAKILKKTKRPGVSYGLDKTAEYRGDNLQFGKATVRFKVKKEGQMVGEFQSLLPGKINVQNSLAAIAVADYLGINLKKIQKGVATFKGVGRRFEIVGRPKGVVIIDDYAHHPTKIKKTLAAARTRYRKNRVYCVFEPHTYSRTRALLGDYARAFGEANEVIVAQLMPAREAGQKPIVTSEEVVKAIKNYHQNVRLIPNSSEISEYLNSKVERGDVVIVMSVGGLGNLVKKLVFAVESGT